MRRAALVASILGTLPLAVWACGDGGSSPAVSSDGGGGDATPDTSVADSAVSQPDSSVAHCKLPNGADPVLLCFQKTLLAAQADAVFADGVGSYASWSSSTLEPDKDDGGHFIHDFHDDVAFAAALAQYQTSALVYGDTQSKATIDALLLKLEAIIEKEMSPLPAEYGGDLYRQLRIVAEGLRVGLHPAVAQRIDDIADAYGKAILTYARPVAGPDAGSGADAGDAGPRARDVLGTPSGGGVAYVTVDVTTGALALIDMAVRHLPDTSTFSADAQAAAVLALDYVWTRGRDPATGMFYASLVTSSDPAHDALAPLQGGQPSDALLLEVQASTALALSRAQELASTPNIGLGAAVTSYPFDNHASAIVDACNGGPVSLWDGFDAADAGAGGGYFEGYVPSTSSMLTTKPSRGNALMYATLRRLLPDVGGNFPWQGRFLRPILTTPAPPLNAGLFSVVSGQSGYFRAATQDFKVTSEPRGASYTSRAVEGMCEALNELWYGYKM